MHVAALLSSPPTSVAGESGDAGARRRDAYYANVTVQLLDLLEAAVGAADMALSRACVLVLSRLARAWSAGTGRLLRTRWGPPLLVSPPPSRPAIGAAAATGAASGGAADGKGEEDATNISTRDSHQGCSDESDVNASVQRMLAVLTLCPPTPSLIAVLVESGLSSAVLRLALYVRSSLRHPTSAHPFCRLFHWHSHSDVTTSNLHRSWPSTPNPGTYTNTDVCQGSCVP